MPVLRAIRDAAPRGCFASQSAKALAIERNFIKQIDVRQQARTSRRKPLNAGCAGARVASDCLKRLYSAVPYLFELDCVPMTEATPGQLLAKVLKDRKIKKSAFSRMVGRSWVTVNSWTKGDGFGPEQQTMAAAALGEPSDFFNAPDLHEQREKFRRDVLKKFRLDALGKTLTQDEWRSLESFRWPEGRAPTLTDCRGIVRIIRGQLTQAEFDSSVREMTDADEPPFSDSPTGKKSPKRPSPTRPRTRPRK